MNKLIEDLSWRYATKEFDSSKKISDEDFQVLLDSLILTPSSFGLQPWKFVVVENTEIRKELVSHSWNQAQVADASHLIVLCRPNTFGDQEVDAYVADTAKKRGQSVEELKGFGDMMKGFLSRMDDEGKTQWMEKQIYIALGQLMTTAAHMRIDACPMEGFINAKYNEALGLSEKGLSSVLVCPVGYRKDSDKYASLAKIRFEKEDLVLKI